MQITSRVLGALLAVCVLGAVVLSTACSGPASMNSKNQGMVQFELSSTGTIAATSVGRPPVSPPAGATLGVSGANGVGNAPARGGGNGLPLTSAVVTLSEITARTTDGLLVPVEIDLPTTFDLLSLAEGQAISLPIGFLPGGTYDQFLVVITGLEVVLEDGTLIEITPPGGAWTSVVPTDPFVVVEGLSTTVELTFCGDLTLLNGEFEFDPQFGCGNGNGHGDEDRDDSDEGED